MYRIDVEEHMEYRKSILVIMTEDVQSSNDWKILEDTFDVVDAKGTDEAKEYFQNGQKKTDAILMCVNKESEEAYSLVEYLNRDVEWCGVPVIVVADTYDAYAEQKFLTL